MILMVQNMDWSQQLPVAAAIVAVVVIFLTYMGKCQRNANMEMRDLSRQWQDSVTRQQEIFVDSLNRMAQTFENTLKQMQK